MATDREVALEQALVALIGAAKNKGLDERALVEHAAALLLGNNQIRYVEHPHVSNAVQALSDAHTEALVLMR